MKTYSEIVGVNSIFQNSVNLELDYNDEVKINQYIPTPEACLILNHYLHSILSDGKTAHYQRATTLVGPYGKGKSFLLLVLMFLISHDSDNQTWNNLVSRIDQVNTETADLLSEMNSRKIRLLPIVLSSDYADISQSFLISLKNYLDANSIADILPDSSYDIGVDIINKWKKDSLFISQIDPVLKEHGVTIANLSKGLKERSRNTYDQFVSIYNSVIKGQPFNPLAGDDLKNVFKSVAKGLHAYNYSGLFMVFDEFSKYLDSGLENTSRDLKLLQDIFEVCNKYEEQYQIHLCCVIHKPLSFYSVGLKTATRNSFKTIEGRVKEILFTRSLSENYRLIEKAILKYKGFEKKWSDIYKKNKSFYSFVENSSLRTESDIEVLSKGCFPMNPYSVFALVQLSEKVAQNERTLFTFLSDSLPDSFTSFINTTADGLLNINQLYDYFSDIFSSDDGPIRQIWVKASAYLAGIQNKKEADVIKALAVILMVDNTSVLPPTAEYISVSTGIEEAETERIITQLEERNVLRVSTFNNLISFAAYNSMLVKERVEDLLNSKNCNFDMAEVMTTISNEKFVIPRQYNAEVKMTRFYRTVFLKGETFLKMTDFSALYSYPDFADGVVIKIVPDAFLEENREELVKHGNSLNGPVVILIPSDSLTDVQCVSFREFYALESIEKTIKDDLMSTEIKIMIDELGHDLNGIIRKIYSSVEIIPSTKTSISELISSQLRKTYNTPIINNELLNKDKITVQYSKARSTVINYILGIGNLSESKTAPDQTVYKSVFQSTDDYEYADDVRTCVDAVGLLMISESDKGKRPVREIADLLKNKPWGLRKGVIPVIVAKAIADLPENHFILTYKEHELPVNADNLISALDNDEKKYYYSFVSNLAEKSKFVISLQNLFNIKSSTRFSEDVAVVATAIKDYCLRLPDLVRVVSLQNNIIVLSADAIAFKTKFMKADINPYELIFEFLPYLGDSNGDLDKAIKVIANLKTELDSALTGYCNDVIQKLKDVFGLSDGSLRSAIQYCIRKEELTPDGSRIGDVIFDEQIGYDDAYIANQLALACIGFYISDWKYDRSGELIASLDEYIHTSNKERKRLLNSSISELADSDVSEEEPMALVLRNMITDALDSFGGSLSEDTKAKVLMSIAAEILK